MLFARRTFRNRISQKLFRQPFYSGIFGPKIDLEVVTPLILEFVVIDCASSHTSE